MFDVYLCKEFRRFGEAPEWYIRKALLPIPPFIGLTICTEQSPDEGEVVKDVFITRYGAAVVVLPDDEWRVAEEGGDVTEAEWPSTKDYALRGWTRWEDVTELA